MDYALCWQSAVPHLTDLGKINNKLLSMRVLFLWLNVLNEESVLQAPA